MQSDPTDIEAQMSGESLQRLLAKLPPRRYFDLKIDFKFEEGS